MLNKKAWLFGTSAGSTPVVQGTATGEENSAVTTHSITLPSGIVANEVLVVCFSHDGGLTSGGVDIDTGSSGLNWNQIADQESNNLVTNVIFWKIAEGSDVLVISSNPSARTSVHYSFRISGANNVTSDYATGTTGSPDAPNHNPAAAKNYLWLAVASLDSAVPSAAPTNYTDLQTAQETGNNTVIAVARREKHGSSEDPGTFTSSSDTWVARTLAVHPL